VLIRVEGGVCVMIIVMIIVILLMVITTIITKTITKTITPPFTSLYHLTPYHPLPAIIITLTEVKSVILIFGY
jgi:hypothetical protein